MSHRSGPKVAEQRALIPPNKLGAWHVARAFGVGLLLMLLAGCGNDAGREDTAKAQFAATTSFVQINAAVPQTSQSSVSLPFNAAQTAGNLNLVVVGWNDVTSTVSSLTDTRGNTYQLAIGPTKRTTFGTQSIYYAKNIAAAAAGANTVSVTFSGAAPAIDVRIAEYAGLDRVNPLDVTVGATGANATSSSGAVTTTNANDLLVAANCVATTTRAAGSGYTSRVITVPNGDILEDRILTAAGSNTAQAPLSSTGDWIMQLVAFRFATATPDTQSKK
jgi:hypothetical protein